MSSSKPAGFVALLLGVLALAAIPAGVVASRHIPGLTLIDAAKISVPAAFLLALVGVAVARRARYRVDRSVSRAGAGLARAARFLVWTGMYVACTAALALGFYGLLVVRG